MTVRNTLGSDPKCVCVCVSVCVGIRLMIGPPFLSGDQVPASQEGHRDVTSGGGGGGWAGLVAIIGKSCDSCRYSGVEDAGALKVACKTQSSVAPIHLSLTALLINFGAPGG